MKSRITLALGIALFLVAMGVLLTKDAWAQLSTRPAPYFPRQSELYSLRLKPSMIGEIQTPDGPRSASMFTISPDAQNRLPVIENVILYYGSVKFLRQGSDGLYRYFLRREPASDPWIVQAKPGFILQAGNYAVDQGTEANEEDVIVATGFWALP